jgi:hypothetical protein
MTMDVKEISEDLENARKMLNQGETHDAAIIHMFDALCRIAAMLGVPNAWEPETGDASVTTTES